MKRIVYLHGFASSPASKKARFFAERLRDAGASVEIPDLTENDFERLTVTAQLQVIERTAGGEPVSLLGSSMGGYLAALHAERHPEIARVVLLAPAFCFARGWEQRMGAAALADWRDGGTVQVWHYGENRTRKLGYGLLEDARKYPDYPDFRQPALLFHGARDDVVPARFSEEFAAAHS